jgi:hypothetical protein
MVGSGMPDRSRAMTQTKSDTLVPQVGVSTCVENLTPQKTSVEETSEMPRRGLKNKKMIWLKGKGFDV